MVDGVSVQGNQLQGPGQLEDPLNLTLYLSWRVESGENRKASPGGSGEWKTSHPPCQAGRGRVGGQLTQTGARVGAFYDNVFAGIVED